MPSLGRNINLSIATFISRIISGSVIYIVLARLMSLNEFGLISFGITLAALLSVIAEFGFSVMAQRDIPQKRFEFNSYVVNVIIQKGAFALVSLISGIAYLTLFYSGINITVGVIFAINAIVTSYNMYFFAVFRAKNLFKIESWLSAIYAVALVLIVITYYFLDLSVIFVSIVLLLSRVLQLISVMIISYSKFKLKLAFSRNIQFSLFKNSFSFGIHYIIGTFYFILDNQLIALFSGNDSVAIYQANYRIVLILLNVNALLDGVFLPYLSKKIMSDPEGFVPMATVLNKILISVGLCTFALYSLFASDIILILYGVKYLPAVSIILPLGIVLVCRNFNSIYAQILTISNHQNLRVIIAIISLAINVSLNIVIIPKYDFVGAAYVSLLTNMVLVCLYLLSTFRVVGSLLLNKSIIGYGLLTVIAVVLKSIFAIEFNLFVSLVIFLSWIVGLIVVLGKKEVVELYKLVYKN